MGMYDDIIEGVSENIEIMGYPFYAENIDGDESFNRRELVRKNILNGTQSVKRGKYIARKYTFTTTLYHPTGRPDAHDQILSEIMSKPVEVISPYMGGIFNAEVIFTKNIPESSPNHITLDVEVNEIPDKESRIPGEVSLVVPEITKVSATKTSKNTLDSATNTKLNEQLKKCNVPFRDGQKNDCVKALQEKLIGLGHLDSKYKSGQYDSNTVEAVKSFQKSNGKLLIDGIFGKYTRDHLVKT
ncbi:peptidoglycan-binding domain-containing protein [Methanobrevibacter sp.]